MNRILFIVISIFVFKTEAQSSTLQLGDSLYVNGNYSKAIEVYKQLEKQSIVYDKNAIVFMALGNYDEALLYYEKSIQSNPDNAFIKYEYAKLATIYNQQKIYKEGTEAFQRAIEENPNNEHEIFLVYTKDKYYEDIDTRIKLHENYLDKLSKSLFKSVADKRISGLKEEQFLKQGKVKEN
jgi:tetratricopeptide (TPR) repeat protein